MMRFAICCAAGLLLVLAPLPGRSRDPNVASTPPRTPEDERRAFHLPPGFEVQLVAAEPDIHKPLNMAFDDRGRLWVTETVEYPFPAGPGRKPRDAVKVLEDFDRDGRAGKITTFADGLNIPIGVLPLPGPVAGAPGLSDTRPQEALVFNIPFVYRFSDNRGVGWADERRVLYREFGSKDTHGMTNSFTWGLDGWVYACHGFSNSSTVKDGRGNAIVMESGNTYRMKADGSRIEYFTHGQVNPFGLCLDPLGNVYSADCHSRPIYQLLRGACYPSFGKPHDGLGFGPEMLRHDHGSTAIAGIVWYAADHFPAPWRGTVFIGNVVTNRINHDRLQWHGSSPRAIEQPDFLRSDDPWFRPVDIKLGPDGALYVADFYNRIIGHYEVPLTHPGRDRERGRIWRIVYRGEDGQGTPAPRTDWTRAAPAELVSDLAHPNLTVRVKATNQLVERGPDGAAAVRRALEDKQAPASPLVWGHGVWVLERLGALDAATLVAAARHPDRLVRVHGQRVLAERPVLAGVERTLALAGLEDADPNVRRAAAEVLGRHPDAANLAPLLALRHSVPGEDTHLLHVVRMALRDQLVPASAWPAARALEGTERDARALADVALGVRSAEAADFLLRYLPRCTEGRERIVEMVHHVARHGAPVAVSGLLDFVRRHQPENLGVQAALFRAIDQGTQERGGRLEGAARAWAEELTGRLLAGAPGDVQAGIDLVGALRLEKYQPKVAELAQSPKAPEGQRQAALNTLMTLDARGNAAGVGKVLADPGAPLPLRENAAGLLARANQPATREQLLLALPAAPARLQNAIAAGLAGSREGADKLLETVAAGKASARLLQERAVAVRLEAARVPDLKERVAKLTEGLPRADQRVQDLLKRRRDGFLKAKTNPALGKAVFAKNCAVCHQLGGEGARIGPQLDGIGVRGLDRLLEDVLDPNRNVDQAFRLTTLELKKGQVVSGLLLREEGAVLVLADAQGKEVRVPRETVAERGTSQISPMPADVADKVPEAEFYHLLAYLLEQRPRQEGR
jgi:putative heme-binding domain-containing protein